MSSNCISSNENLFEAQDLLALQKNITKKHYKFRITPS